MIPSWHSSLFCLNGGCSLTRTNLFLRWIAMFLFEIGQQSLHMGRGFWSKHYVHPSWGQQRKERWRTPGVNWRKQRRIGQQMPHRGWCPLQQVWAKRKAMLIRARSWLLPETVLACKSLQARDIHWFCSFHQMSSVCGVSHYAWSRQ